MSLANKVVIVTGGNSGIGRAVALELARQGASLVIDYVSHPDAADAVEKKMEALEGGELGDYYCPPPKGADAVEKEIAALGASVIGVQADVSKKQDLERLLSAT